MNTKGITGANGVDPLRPKKSDEAKNASLIKPGGDLPDAKGAKASKGYDVTLSGKAKEMADARAKAKMIAKNTPSVRDDKVASLKQRIQEGNYKPDPAKIADGMMKEALRDQLAQQMHEEAKKR